jgi:protein SCO1/2
MTVNRLSLIVAALVVAVAAGIAASMFVGQGRSALSGRVPIGGDFALTDHTGARVGEASFRGRLMLVYFGYTWCPDVCPTELQVIGAALDLVGEDASEVAALFITVDPERDTWQVLADYVPHFHERLIALTGTPRDIAAAARAYRVYYAKADAGDGAYLMDHTSLVYLMDRDGAYLRHFTGAATAEEIAAAVREAL